MGNLYDAVIKAESSGNPLAQSIKGARGLMQVTQPALLDYNVYNKANLNMDDMFDPQLNQQVGAWYLSQRIPQMLRAYKLPVNTDTILWSYNAGIGNVKKGIKPKETKAYIEKIKKYLGE